MKVIYKPEGQQPREWVFDPRRMRAIDAEGIERRWNGEPATIEGWRAAVLQGSARARRLLLWLMLRGDDPKIRFEDVNPYLGEIDVDLDVGELTEIRDQLAARKFKTQELRDAQEARLSQLDQFIEEEGGESEDAVDPTETPTQ